MKTTWEGVYLDGQTAERQGATIQPMEEGLQFTTQSGLKLWWPYEEIRQTQGFYAGEQVRLERGGEFPEMLLISDSTFLTALHRIAPGMTMHIHDPTGRGLRVKLTLMAAVAALGLTALLYAFGIPGMAVLVTYLVPISWEEGLGSAIVERLAPEKERCTDADLIRILNSMTSKLTTTLSSNPFEFRVMVVRTPIMNAFAAPGGYIVFFSGLLERTRTPDELAGVLAHEMQHIVQRHTTRSILQEISTGLLLAAMFGDPSAVEAYGLEGARMLGRLGYSRRHEEEADREGMRMILEAGIDPKGMVDFYIQLLDESGEPSGLKTYLSTHPSTKDRIERLKALAGQSSVESRSRAVKLFSYLDWDSIKTVCHATDR